MLDNSIPLFHLELHTSSNCHGSVVLYRLECLFPMGPVSLVVLYCFISSVASQPEKGLAPKLHFGPGS